MNRLSLVVCYGLIPLVFACSDQQIPYAAVEQARQARAEYDSAAQQVVQSLAYLGAPLKDLSEEQMASVAALIVLTRLTAQTDGILGAAGSMLGEGFWTEVPEICPPIPDPPAFEFGDCLDEEIAYATAMANCRDEDKSDDECDQEAAGEGAAAIMCHMRELEEMRTIIVRIPGRAWPTDPFPWPIDDQMVGGPIHP